MKTIPTAKTKKATVIRKEWPRVRDLSPVGKRLFVVDARPHGRREGYPTEAEALTRAEQLALEVENKGIEALSFPTKARIMASDCIAKLEPLGKTLKDATDHYVSWLLAEQRKSQSRTVATCIAEYLKARELDHRRDELAAASLREIRVKVGKIGKALGPMPILAMDLPTVRTFLDSLPHTARTRLNYKLRLSKFLNFCKEQGWLEKNPCEEISIRVKKIEVTMLSVRDSAALLKAASKSAHASTLVPYSAICLFAGLRPGEAEQLDWKYVHFDTATIEVRAETSKTRETRFVKMEPVLVEWLRPYAKTSGRIIHPNFRNWWNEVRAVAGWILRKEEGEQNAEDRSFMKGMPDVLRHSYASYWLAVNKNRYELAELMGNSPTVIKNHYRRPILETVGKTFWNLSPSSIDEALR